MSRVLPCAHPIAVKTVAAEKIRATPGIKDGFKDKITDTNLSSNFFVIKSFYCVGRGRGGGRKENALL